MATVVRAYDQLLQVHRAIKLLAPAFRDKERIRQRFMDEARVMARLRHPNIVPVFDVGEQDGTPYIVMGLVEGGDLAEHIVANKTLDIAEAIRLILGVLSGLGAVHAAGIVHRDIKPQNILIDPQGVPLLTDFGIARHDHEDRSMTKTGATMGTMAYMPPEQRDSAKDVTPASDLFAVGATLYAALMGKLPQHLYVQENRDAALAGMQPAVRAVVSRACSFRPEDRYASAHEMAAALYAAGVDAESSPATGPDAPTEMEAHTTAVERPQTNLVARLDRFLGRTDALGVLEGHLVDGTSRLVTLLGPGGTGKTRLAQEFGLRSLSGFPGGVWFADLSNAQTVEGVCGAVGAALGLQLTQSDPVLHLGTAMRGRGRTLLILDTLEQVIDVSAGLIKTWLGNAPELRILVTSRERIRVPGEDVVTVPPLSPQEAVALFEARTIHEGMTGPPVDLAIVEGIVAHLDGLPLAVELAAAQVGVMSVEDLLERMEAQTLEGAETTLSFDGLLAADWRGRSSRERTLRGAIDWSWRLLKPWEQAALAQCSVFRGGFELEAAEAVIDLSDHPDAPSVLRVVTSLVDKSMLQVTEPEEGLRRLGMLKSILRYSLDQLHSKEQELLQLRHAAYYQILGQVEDGAWAVTRDLPRLGLERDNLHRGCEMALFAREWSSAVGCALGLDRIIRRRGPFAAGLKVVEKVLSEIPSDQPERCRMEMVRGRLLFRSGEVKAGQDSLLLALGASREASQRRLEGEVLIQLGYLELQQGDLQSAQSRFQAALEIHRSAGHRSAELTALVAMGDLQRLSGDAAKAKATLDEALVLCQEVGERYVETGVLYSLAWLHHDQGRVDQAELYYGTSLALAQALGHSEAILRNLRAQGWVHQERGKMKQAKKCFEAALEKAKSMGRRHDVGSLLGSLGTVDMQEGRWEASLPWSLACIEIAVELGAQRMEGGARLNFAEALKNLGRVAEAEEQLTMALPLLEGIHPAAWAMCLSNLAMIRVDRGAGAAAVKMADEALQTARETGAQEIVGIILAHRAHVYRAIGDTVTMEACLDEAEAIRQRLKMSERSNLANAIAGARGQD